MKKAIITVAALVLSTGAALAAPGGKYKNDHRHGISAYERAAIARSAANVAQLKRRVWADGRVTLFERMQLRSAERRHAALVARAYRT